MGWCGGLFLEDVSRWRELDLYCPCCLAMGYLRHYPAGDINEDRIVNFLDLCIIAEQWMKNTMD